MEGSVGASIVSIVTESLYDKPIVVFREYIQNAADAMEKADPKKNLHLSAAIWHQNEDLYFLDNATGIPESKFRDTMTSIAKSEKVKSRNIGYKGIGRLSGISYCKELVFVNIIDYSASRYQTYRISCEKYDSSKVNGELSFSEWINKIGSYSNAPPDQDLMKQIKNKDSLFKSRKTGFFVALKGISSVLQNVINDTSCKEQLEWLLPVPFLPALSSPFDDKDTTYALFQSIAENNGDNANAIQSIQDRSFSIWYNETELFRPLTREMFRTYLCTSKLDQYAVSIHSFSNRKIALSSDNKFSGIRIYYNNILLCDENELIPALQLYGFTRHGTYELIQSVRGIGALIYIVDNVNISANARRTFIDVTDNNAIDFLSLLGRFVEYVYQARYALSKLNGATQKGKAREEQLKELRTNALEALSNLAQETVSIELVTADEPKDFSSFTDTEKKRYVKSVIQEKVDTYLSRFLSQTTEFRPDTCFNDFRTWMEANLE